LCFAALDATSKYLSRTYPIPMMVWGRYTFHLPDDADLPRAVDAPAVDRHLATAGADYARSDADRHHGIFDGRLFDDAAGGKHRLPVRHAAGRGHPLALAAQGIDHRAATGSR
jgi:hypothetical protein